MLDLTDYYNVSLKESLDLRNQNDTLSELPTGVQKLAGRWFDVRGVICLEGRNAESAGNGLPPEVDGIPVGRKCQSLHFLHGARGSGDLTQMMIGSYVLHYADGEKETLNVHEKRDVLPWHWGQKGPMETYPLKDIRASSPTNGMPQFDRLGWGEVAWVGSNPVAQASYDCLRLFVRSWANPRPGQEIQSIDFVAAGRPVQPFLLAITVE